MRPAVVLAASLLLATPALGQIAISANDGKIVLTDGNQVVPQTPEPDTVTILDISTSAPRVVGEVEVPTSVIGPPESVAIAPDKSYALVTAATKIDPLDSGRTVSDNTVTVIDLRAKPVAVVQTVRAGAGATGVSINHAGTLALVANRDAGSISVFAIKNRRLSPAGSLTLDPKSGPSHVVFTPDGATALVTRDGDSKISVLAIDGDKVTDTGADIYAGLRPYGIDISRRGDIAAVANIGKGGIDNDTISLIDLKTKPFHVVNTVSVGPTPEGIALSPDDKYIAVSAINGSNKAKSAPGFHDFGWLRIYRRNGFNLSLVASARTGHWCEGVVWTADRRAVLVQCMVEKRIFAYEFDGKSLQTRAGIAVRGGPAGIRAAY